MKAQLILTSAVLILAGCGNKREYDASEQKNKVVENEVKNEYVYIDKGNTAHTNLKCSKLGYFNFSLDVSPELLGIRFIKNEELTTETLTERLWYCPSCFSVEEYERLLMSSEENEIIDYAPGMLSQL